MPPKTKIPAPIDRPLSRAYLREFSGWSTAYPPGLSEPTSLRIMENTQVNRDGSLRVRPGLRNLTKMQTLSPAPVSHLPLASTLKIVGTHETFYDSAGRRAVLFAVLDTTIAEGTSAWDKAVTFRIGTWIGNELRVQTLEAAGTASSGDAVLAFDTSAWAAPGPYFSGDTTYVKYVQIDNKLLALSNNGEPARLFYVGATKKVPYLEKLDYPKTYGTGLGTAFWAAAGHPAVSWINGTQATNPTYVTTAQATSLVSSTTANNVYNHAWAMTLSNELGESEPTRVSGATRFQRPFGSWLFQGATDGGSAANIAAPNGADVSDPVKSADQVILYPFAAPAAFDAAVAKGANRINVYLAVWSDQAPRPSELHHVASKDLTAGMGSADAWVQIHPGSQGNGRSIPWPHTSNVRDTTGPPTSAQGIVAADRLVLVYDPVESAVIRWSTNDMGDYLNLSQSAGGGYKTLTSGNMQVPATVKLWQNPESKDSLIVLNMGTDGYSTSYYMAPASVTSQSDNTVIMAFEETTATPGTVSPFGCEVANNTLYHPLDDQLMKSTASNYNINHKSMTDNIANMWKPLADKKKTVSCFYDQRLYYLVHNPDGAELEEHCNGNEVWVLDLGSESGTWSRWLTQGVSLRKTAVDGRPVLSMIRPDGIFYFDDSTSLDHVIDGGVISEVPISWQIETNTQGANRAHDAWCNLQGLTLNVGCFTGTMRYGVRGWDVNGKPVKIEKVLRDLNAPSTDGLPWDLEDQLLVRKQMKEWYFYASSVEDGETPSQTLVSAGQLNSLQYRYTPTTVNVGYEHGSVETFEYGRATTNWAERTTDNGVPIPANDQRRP